MKHWMLTLLLLLTIVSHARAQDTTGIPPIPLADLQDNVAVFVPMMNTWIAYCGDDPLTVGKLDFIGIYTMLSTKMKTRSDSLQPKTACDSCVEKIDQFFRCLMTNKVSSSMDKIVNNSRFIPYFKKEIIKNSQDASKIKPGEVESLLEGVKTFYNDLLKDYKVTATGNSQG